MIEQSKNDKRWFGLSQFDLIVAGVSLVLVIGVALVAIIGQPQPIGAAVAYLAPADVRVQNVWLTRLDDPENPIQITDSETGIYDFGVSDDGTQVAYSQRDPETGLNDIYLINLQTRQTQRLTDCASERADCRTPVFRPGGGLIAYERVESNPEVQAGPGAIRIWMVDMRSTPYTTSPLALDSQIIGYGPQWSDDGTAVAFYSAEVSNPGVLVYRFLPDAGEESTLKFVPSSHGSVGSLSPDGTQLVVPEVTRLDPNTLVTYLRLANLPDNEIDDFTDPGQPVDDSIARWNPDGQHLVVERRYLDDRYTRGYQLYLLDAVTADAEPILVDDRYSHGFAYWNQAGDKLAFQRFQLVTAEGDPVTNARTEIWVYDTVTETPVKLADNAFHPRWLEQFD